MHLKHYHFTSVWVEAPTCLLVSSLSHKSNFKFHKWKTGKCSTFPLICTASWQAGSGNVQTSKETSWKGRDVESDPFSLRGQYLSVSIELGWLTWKLLAMNTKGHQQGNHHGERNSLTNPLKTPKTKSAISNRNIMQMHI